jgi:hypothetical protein
MASAVRVFNNDIVAEVRLRTGSLSPCILIHGAYNGVAALADWLP